jgi:hypothetical protein
MRIRLSPLAHDKKQIKNISNKLHFKSSIISQTSFKVGFHNNSSSSIIVYEDVLIAIKKYYNTINKNAVFIDGYLK